MVSKTRVSEEKLRRKCERTCVRAVCKRCKQKMCAYERNGYCFVETIRRLSWSRNYTYHNPDSIIFESPLTIDIFLIPVTLLRCLNANPIVYTDLT